LLDVLSALIPGLISATLVHAGQTLQPQPPPQPTPTAQPQRPQAPPRDRARPTEPQPEGTAVISGRVAAADTGRPLNRVRVLASATELRSNRAAMTDREGRYEIAGLPAGKYTITASKGGFVQLTHGQTRPMAPGAPIDIRDAQRIQVDFRLPRGGVITGRVVDETGEPMAGVGVRVMRLQMQRGQRELAPVGMDQTDDRGEYRVFGLTPGEYIVSAEARGALAGMADMAMAFSAGGPGGPPGPLARDGPAAGIVERFVGIAGPQVEQGDLRLAPTYYPGTVNPAQATRVAVGLSQEVANIDIALQLTPTSTIRGTVVAGGGGGLGRGAVMLNADLAGGRGFARAYSGPIDATGAFTVRNVPPGRYTLTVIVSTAGDARALYAQQQLTVDGSDLDGLAIVAMPGAILEGIVEYEATAGGQRPSGRLRISAQSIDASSPLERGVAFRMEADGRFTLDGTPAGPRFIRVQDVPRGWRLKSIIVNGRDVADAPIDLQPGQRLTGVRVILTDRATRVSGVVTDDGGRGTAGGAVIVFSANPDDWHPLTRRIGAAQSDQHGRYDVNNLPPGEYLIAAVGDVERDEWFDPAFLERLRPLAERVLIAEGDAKTHDLRISARP
jgi:protocatechuate 3,4-dioxygenase beta subunit